MDVIIRWSDALREGAWLERRRVTAIAAMLLIAYLPMLAHAFLNATRGAGSDFLAFWGAARLVVAGTPELAYDLAAETMEQGVSGITGMFAYVNPPPFLLVAAPFGWLSYPAALILWSLIGWAAWLLVARRVMPEATLAIVAFPGAYLAASHAQNGFLTGALLIGGVLALKRSQALSGAAFGALIDKPHLALFAPLWLATGGKWRALSAGAATAAALCLASLLAFGPATWLAYPQSFAVSAAIMDQPPGEFFLRMGTVWSGLRQWFGADVALAGQATVTLGCAALVVLAWRRTRDEDATGAVMLAATALGSPYLFAYDLAFMAMPLFWLAREGREHGFRPCERSALAALYVAPLAARAAALPLGLNLTPVAAAALLALTWTRLERTARADPVQPAQRWIFSRAR